jgi:two-component system CheB/CheR fusion protein
MNGSESQIKKTKSSDATDPQFEALLDYLRFSRGFDFTGYKRSSLMRLVTKRRHYLAMASFSEYLDYLQVHPDEFAYLFNTILINVTSFFRDKPAWDYLNSEILPGLLENKGPREPIRVWSAGCASGEEAYSLAIALAEILGPEAFRQRVKIYATDMDNDALTQARQAMYSADDVKNVPEDLLEKYFTLFNGEYVFNGDPRRAVIFGQHDLVQDAPISRLDLLVCRNTIMYFNAETQARILARFHFALNDTGILFLGKAEMLLTHANLFTALDLKYRFFSKASRPELRDRLLALGQGNEELVNNRLARQLRMRDLAFDTSPQAHVIIDLNGMLLAANESAKVIFSIAAKDIGGKLQDLSFCYKPIALRPLIDQAIAERRNVLVPAVEYCPTNTLPNIYLDIHVVPLTDNNNHILGVSIIFDDISRNKLLEEQLKNSTSELETTNEELQSTNEELETTNEELQSTVEELETTNEELQSTNEELETMNEELQSTNEELETINDELSQRTAELNSSKAFLETILGNLHGGLVVVDRDFHILTWSSQMEDLWGLRAEEIMGQSLLGLDIGLPVEKLKQPIRFILDGASEAEEIVLTAVNRRGKSFQCQVTFTPFSSNGKERQGAVMMMDEKLEEI